MKNKKKKRSYLNFVKRIIYIFINILFIFYFYNSEFNFHGPLINNHLYKQERLSDKLKWPPLKIYVYPKNKYHTDDCLYPPEMPNRYINETNYWFQRMLEPTVHLQFLQSPLYTQNPDESDLFFIPHYSRMCSGLPHDNGKRWRNISPYLNKSGMYFQRYSQVDHIIMHSVPQYGDKPADNAVLSPKSPIICLLDFRVTKMRNNPWTFSKSVLVPFITIPIDLREAENHERNFSAFVAMSTSTKGLKARSAELRQTVENKLLNVSKSYVLTIIRNNYSTFRFAIDNLKNFMIESNLCIVPPGDAPSSKRFYDAVNALCVPYLISDYFFLPFEGSVFDYDDFIFQLSSKKIYLLSQNLNEIIQNNLSEIIRKRENLKIMKERFTWNYKKPPKKGQALWTLSWAVFDKFQMIKPYLNNEMTGYENDEYFDIVS
ncbi:hypothetical protein M9Y10_017507 [Tritrichomonas musculus]|uniref:Exostosin GT47 domain-containing protein n=1 Tax=Tritrichomonas musculus TaxID=1915356 RepID=A0ABR2GJM8_9EUKA